jgi:hypothetical protein
MASGHHRRTGSHADSMMRSELERLPHALRIQRIYRGVRARRLFSDLFYNAVEASLGPDVVPLPSPVDYGEEVQRTRQRSSPSLEEAQREAAYNPSANCLAHVALSPSYMRRQRNAIADSVDSGAGACTCAAYGCSSPYASGAPAATTASSRHLRTPSRGSAVLTGADAIVRAPAHHSRTSSSGGAPTPAAAPASALPTHAQHPAHQPAHHKAQPRRLQGEHASATGGAPSSLGGGDDPAGAPSSDLEFTSEMADSMSLEALRELAAVLTRVIGTRNKELVALQERRDELRHEREFRQATVNALISQVDRSQFVREERKKSARGRKSL